jgi:hypothetical protein
MAKIALALATFGAFVVLLWLGLPRADRTPSSIARNEHVASAYSVLLVALLVCTFGLLFTAR